LSYSNISIAERNAIEDGYRETNKEEKLIRLRTNIRSYNAEYGWTMKWFDALNSTWLDLGPKEFGGVHIDVSTITFKHFAANNIIVRITFFDITKTYFSWKADVANDNGKIGMKKL